MNLQDVRKGLTQIRDGLKQIREELNEYYADVNLQDRYAAKMWSFIGNATRKVEDLIDDVNLADATFTKSLKYFGEDDKNMSSSEFYGIFKTFVISYRASFPIVPRKYVDLSSQKCQTENRSAASEREAHEKRKKAAEEMREQRNKKTDYSFTAQEGGDTAALDNLLEKLRNGDSIGRRRNKGRAGRRAPQAPAADVPPVPKDEVNERAVFTPTNGAENAADLARDMLARLQSDGFNAFTPTPTQSRPPRRPRRRREAGNSDGGTEDSPAGVNTPIATSDSSSVHTPPELTPLPLSPIEDKEEEEPFARYLELGYTDDQ